MSTDVHVRFDRVEFTGKLLLKPIHAAIDWNGVEPAGSHYVHVSVFRIRVILELHLRQIVLFCIYVDVVRPFSNARSNDNLSILGVRSNSIEHDLTLADHGTN